MQTLKRFFSFPSTRSLGVFGLTLLLFVGSAQAAIEVGKVNYSRGVLTGKPEGGNARLMGKGQSITQGETLTTGRGSFAIINLNDGTKMTLRPNTVFRVDQFNTNAGEESALLSLLKGGFRAITGSISKRLNSAFKVRTTVATIGIRGTEFDARLCTDTDCEAENQQLTQTAVSDQALESNAIARVVRLKGNARASSETGKARALRVGATVFAKDRINTGINSYAVIAFNDESRMTLTSNSEMVIREHNYEPDKPEENNSFIEFVRGGLRFLTGAIGKLNNEAVRVATPVATIGIRGTGFDLLCSGQCGAGQTSMIDPTQQTIIGKLLNSLFKPGYAQSSGASEMYARVWNGAIILNTETDSLLLNNNQTAVMPNARSKPRIVVVIPPALQSMETTPRPDQVPFKPEWFQKVSAGDKIDAGLYVQVKEGVVAIEGAGLDEVLLAQQEAGKVNLAGVVSRLTAVPNFQRYDKYPRPTDVSRRLENLLNLMGEDVEDINDFQCVVQ